MLLFQRDISKELKTKSLRIRIVYKIDAFNEVMPNFFDKTGLTFKQKIMEGAYVR